MKLEMTPPATDGPLVLPKWRWIAWTAVFFLHVLFYDTTWFSIDQARDLIQAMDIAAGRNYPLSGPLMHWIAHIGPLYYYALAFPFLIYSRPEAAYFFLALISTATVAVGHWFLGRYFNARAALLFVCLYVPSAFVLMDSRALWTPAFLPFLTLLALSSMATFFWENKDQGLVILALVVGIGSQFHLAFMLVVPIFLAAWICYRRRVQWSSLLWSAIAGLLTYVPYLYYQAANNWIDIRAFFNFASQGAVETASSSASYAVRLLNYFLVPVYLAGPWLGLSGFWLGVFQFTAGMFSILLALAVVHLLVQIGIGAQAKSLPNDRRMLLLGFFIGILAMLLARKVDLYYYYFDLLYPVPYFLVALFLEDTWRRYATGKVLVPARNIAVALLLAFALVQGGAYYFWLIRSREAGLFHLPLAMLDLHRIHLAVDNPDETFMTLKAKKEIAGMAVRSWGWQRTEAYKNLLGSRFYDATEERGYWLHYYEQQIAAPVEGQPMVLWHRSDPMERWAERFKLKVRTLNSFCVAPLDVSVFPERWYTGLGRSITLPARVVPELRDYGFVPASRWETDPVILTGNFNLMQRPAQYLLVIITKGENPVPSLEVNSNSCQSQEKHRTLMTLEHYYEVSAAMKSGDNRITLKLTGKRNFDLEVFGWAMQ